MLRPSISAELTVAAAAVLFNRSFDTDMLRRAGQLRH